MSKLAKVAPIPCVCGRGVTITPQQGGRGTGEITVYQVACACGVYQSGFAWNTGRMRTAIIQWNRWVQSRQSHTRATGGKP